MAEIAKRQVGGGCRGAVSTEALVIGPASTLLAEPPSAGIPAGRLSVR